MIRYVITLLLAFLTSCGSDKLVEGLIEAASKEDVSQMTLLIERGANVNGVALDGWTPLTAAAAAGRLEAVKLLLTRGADINRGVVTPLHWAAFHGHLGVAKFLVGNGARLNLDPVVKASFLVRVRSYGEGELMSLVTDVMAREKS